MSEELILGLMGLMIMFFIYFLPAFISILRRHRDIMAITFLNLLAGWTFIGWLIAFIWSVKAFDRKE